MYSKIVISFCAFTFQSVVINDITIQSIVHYNPIYFSYHKQAAADVEAVWRRTLQLLRQLGRSSDSILEKDVKLFCRHVANIHVEKGSCIADEYDPKVFDTNVIGNCLFKKYKIIIYNLIYNS